MQRILIIRFSALGDLVLLEPSFRAIRHFYKDAHITFVSSSIGSELYSDSGYFDLCITLDNKRYKNPLSRARALHSQLGDTFFNIVFNLQGSTVSHLLALLVKKKRLVNSSRNLWQKIFSLKIKGKKPEQFIRESGITKSALDNYFKSSAATQISLQADQTLVSTFQRLLSASGGNKPTIALAPGASVRWESKKWGDDHFAELARRLSRAGYSIVIIGSALEHAAANRIRSMAPEAIDFTNQTSIRELKALLSTTVGLIGNDSGPAHIAAGLGVPTVTVFAPTSSIHCAKHFPYRGNHACATPENVNCTTCYDPVCPRSRECMSGITIDRLFETALDTFSSAEQSKKT